MLDLDETATDGDILMAVQEVVERAAQGGGITGVDAPDAGITAAEDLVLDGEDESRVEQIRARVRELNERYGREITPMAMFDLIMGEFGRQSSRRD